jgi:hypothetical protein
LALSLTMKKKYRELELDSISGNVDTEQDSMITSVPMTATLPLQTTTESQFTGQTDPTGQQLIHQRLSDVSLNM